MKKITFSSIMFLFLLTVNLYSQINQDWKWQHPFPQGNIIRYTKVVDAQNWVMVGESGVFIKTTNGGANFTVTTNAGTVTPVGNMQSKPLYNGWFFNANTGMVCGYSGYFARTTNGGTTWDTTITTGVTSFLYGIHFINDNTGYMCGSSAKLLKTTNAGLNWNPVTVTGFTTGMYNVFALDTNYIWASLSNSRAVAFTTNAGVNWYYTPATFGLSFAQDINFVDQNTGFACGNAGKVYYTTNGGYNWIANPTTGTNTLYHIFTEPLPGTPTVPYSEGFEGTFLPTGWQKVNVSGTNEWTQSTTSVHSGTYSAFINYQSTGGEDWLITPKWSIQSGDSLKFWVAKNFSAVYPPDSLLVKVSATDSATGSFISTIKSIDVANLGLGWFEYKIPLSAFAGQNIYIAFQHKDLDGNGCYLDDVSITRQVNNAYVYVTGDPYNIFRRTLTDTTWTAIPCLGPTQMWTSQYFSSSKLGNIWLTAGGQGMMNISTNGGANWTDKTFMISAGNRNDIWADTYNGKAITVGNLGATGANDQVMITTNGGTNWTLSGISSTSGFYSISMVNTNTGYISGSAGAVQKTTNGGFNWTALTTPIPTTESLNKISFVDANTGWVFSNSVNASGTIWKTTNAGVNWTQSLLTATDSSRINGGQMINANTGWVISNLPALTPRPYKTTDGGATWTRQDNYSGTWPPYLLGMQMMDANTGYITGGYSTASLIKTTDGGANWFPVALPWTTGYYDVHFANQNFGMVVGSTGFIAITTNGGTSWTYQNANEGNLTSCWMFPNGNSYVAGNGQTFPHAAILKNSNTLTGGIEYSGNLPEKYTLNQNYPNPFNPTTTIKFALPKAGNVSILIYDVAGREVTRLINNAPLNAGSFDVKFDGSNLSSGIYFYKLLVDGNTISTKKMSLIK